MKKTHHTDSGMLCIWDYESFKHIHDYDSWDKELCEDANIRNNISKSAFVPLNLGDGAFEVNVRFDSNRYLTDRENAYLLVPSQPYLLKTSGIICLSGLEHVSRDIGQNVSKFDVEQGTYAVQINLIDWNQEPGAVDSQGGPTNMALPDMIVFMNKFVDSDSNFRTEIETFRKEDALR